MTTKNKIRRRRRKTHKHRGGANSLDQLIKDNKHRIVYDVIIPSEQILHEKNDYILKENIKNILNSNPDYECLSFLRYFLTGDQRENPIYSKLIQNNKETIFAEYKNKKENLDNDYKGLYTIQMMFVFLHPLK